MQLQLPLPVLSCLGYVSSWESSAKQGLDLVETWRYIRLWAGDLALLWALKNQRVGLCQVTAGVRKGRCLPHLPEAGKPSEIILS